MKEDLFLSRYKSLNKGQLEAVDTIDGPVMVIAGPGTGKTTVLTLRIANILRKTDTPPDGILALTFTESGVISMRRKLVSFIGSAAYRVGIFTFHGFAEEVIQKFPEYFPRIIGGGIATESEKLSIIERIIDNNKFEKIKPYGSPYHYVNGALHTISDLKRDAITPEAFEEILNKEEKDILSKEDLKHQKGKYKGEIKSIYKDALKNIEKNKELVTLYREYEKSLAEDKLYDYDDMLLELLKAFKNYPDLLQSLQEEYLYFLADEHQDANNAQNTILENLSSYFDEPNLFIVGDEKQAIYRFQGASLENFLYFKKTFPTAKLIYLDENYRSHQTILDASHLLALPLPGDKNMRPQLVSKNERKEGIIEVINFESESDESQGIAKAIKSELEKGVPAEEIAVLVRTNKEISQLGQILITSGIPVTLFQDEDVLADPDIGKLLLLLRSINDPTNDTLLAEVLFIDFLELNPIEVIKVLHQSRNDKIKIIDSLDNFEGFKEKYSNWVTLAKNKNALEVVTSILSDSSLTDRFLSLTNSIEKMALLSALYQEIASRQAHKHDSTLKDFLSDIDTLKEHGAKLSFSSRLRKERTVGVMTAHRSKGLEWQVVVIPHLVAGHWGSKRSNLSFRLPYPLGNAHQSGKEEDERRLLYVAMTRAKERIILTYSSKAIDGKEFLPSGFLEELPKDLLKESNGDEIGPIPTLVGALASKVSRENTLWDQDYLREAFFSQGLNATALNNYIECPWKYFFKNLVRIPDVMTKHQMYGTAVHFALSEMTKSLRQHKIFEEEDLYRAFEECLKKQPISDRDLLESLKKGARVIKILYKSERELWKTEAMAEFNISGVIINLSDDQPLLLRGRLDKVDLLGNDEVCVVDFKTGKPKSRNDILGLTKNSKGNEKRQLDFYRLLLDLYDNGKYKMTSGTILFTEPDERERIKKETFEITSEDSHRVKEETIRIAEEIINFDFWDKKCSDKDCEFCSLRETLIS